MELYTPIKFEYVHDTRRLIANSFIQYCDKNDFVRDTSLQTLMNQESTETLNIQGTNLKILLTL